jgi:predicted DCC family thiol-disulfide oxidoreductase YuxK
MTSVTVFYDGQCPLCRREIALMRRLDRARKIDFLDVSAAGPSSCPLDRETLLARFHALEDGRLYSGAAAFAAMWRAIPLLRPLGLLARAPLVLGLLESAYILFLRVRPRLQSAVGRWDDR